MNNGCRDGHPTAALREHQRVRARATSNPAQLLVRLAQSLPARCAAIDRHPHRQGIDEQTLPPASAPVSCLHRGQTATVPNTTSCAPRQPRRAPGPRPGDTRLTTHAGQLHVHSCAAPANSSSGNSCRASVIPPPSPSTSSSPKGAVGSWISPQHAPEELLSAEPDSASTTRERATKLTERYGLP